MKDYIPPGGTVLPFQSRNVRHSEEELSTDDVEVVQHVRAAAKLAPSSNKFGTTLRSTGVASERAASSRRNPRQHLGQTDRPQIPAPIPASTRAHVALESFSEPDEEMTCLMPSKLILPPASKRSNEMRSTSFRPQHQPQPMRAPHTPQPMRAMAARQESMISHADSMIHHHIPAAPASLAPMAMPSVDSDPRFNPGATVMTSRSLAGRPTVSWAAALVVMGIFAGLVTAAVARGDLDGDAKVAAASQGPAVQQVIPPSAQAQLAAASQPGASPMMGSLYNSGTTSSMAVSTPVNAAPVMMQQPMQQPVMQQPVMQQPVAVAAPIAAKFTPAPRAVAPRAAAPAPVAHVAKADPKPEVKEEKKVAAKSKKDSKSDDMASAKEAQALADAQLAASL
jgi:hypothetical protein